MPIKIAFFCFFICFLSSTRAQDSILLPVKEKGKWGIINQEGKKIVPPLYDAISSFKHFGYAVVQKEDKTGLVNHKGDFILALEYNDVRVYSKNIFGIAKDDNWHLIDRQKRIILTDYDRIEIIDNNYIKYWRDEFCGIIHINGKEIIPPSYKKIKWLKKDRYFQVRKSGKIGLFSLSGKLIAPVKYKEIQILFPSFILVKSKYKWGAIDNEGTHLLPEHYSHYKIANKNFILIYKQDNCYLFSIQEKTFISHAAYENFIPLNKNWIVFQKYKKVGLMNSLGIMIIPNSFQEIRVFHKELFRVKLDEKWGIVSEKNELISPIIFDYISPYENYHAIVKKDNLYGILNQEGKLVANTIYDRLEIDKNKIKAHKGDKVTFFSVSRNGIVQGNEYEDFSTINISPSKDKNKEHHLHLENYQLNDFEWYYSPQKGKWGLRDINTGENRIPPVFDFVEIHRKYGFTVAGNRKTIKQLFGDFPVRFEYHFCLVNNYTGLQITKLNIREIRFSDFEKGLSTARVIFDDDRHGLISRGSNILKETAYKGGFENDTMSQKVIINDNNKAQLVNTVGVISKGFAYIGEFEEGIAPIALYGKLGVVKSSEDFAICPIDEYLIGSYGRYIIGEFGYIPKRIPYLTCKDCAWGYIDTLGRLKVAPDYEAAKPFKNKTGIVKKNGLWGVVNQSGDEIVNFSYHKISRFQDEESGLLHLEKKCDKYGLIDSLGSSICNSEYDIIRPISENLIAVKLNNKWGFISPRGNIVIPINYVKVEDFSEGKAAVFDGLKWGFINRAGQIIIEHQFSRVGSFKCDLAWAKTDKGLGYINTSGNFIIPPIYKKVFDFENGIARVIEKEKIKLIDTQGNTIGHHHFDDLSSFDKYGLAVARENKKNNIYYYLVNKKGERVSSHSFRKIFPFHEGLAAVKKKQKYGFISAQGEIIVPIIYDKVSIFSEGRAWVKIDGKCGYINKMGKVIVDFEFNKCSDFEDGKAVVYVNARKGGLVDKEGDYVIQPQIKNLIKYSEGKGLAKNYQKKYYFIRESGEMYEGYFDEATEFENGAAFVKLNHKWGVINTKGAIIITPKYEKIERMNSSISIVKVSKLHGICNAQGQSLIASEYEYVSYLKGGIIKIEQGAKVGYMDSQGKWIWKMKK